MIDVSSHVAEFLRTNKSKHLRAAAEALKAAGDPRHVFFSRVADLHGIGVKPHPWTARSGDSTPMDLVQSVWKHRGHFHKHGEVTHRLGFLSAPRRNDMPGRRANESHELTGELPDRVVVPMLMHSLGITKPDGRFVADIHAPLTRAEIHGLHSVPGYLDFAKRYSLSQAENPDPYQALISEHGVHKYHEAMNNLKKIGLS